MSVAVVIINRHEPEGEVAGKLLDLAGEKGYDVYSVQAQRGEHDASLSFRVPQDVADAFNDERASLWPADVEPVPDDADPTPPARETRSGKTRE